MRVAVQLEEAVLDVDDLLRPGRVTVGELLREDGIELVVVAEVIGGNRAEDPDEVGRHPQVRGEFVEVVRQQLRQAVHTVDPDRPLPRQVVQPDVFELDWALATSVKFSGKPRRADELLEAVAEKAAGWGDDRFELRAKIESREIESGPPGDAETFTIIGDLLRETYAPPALRAALYQVAAGLPGVELVGETKDHEGRDGVGVAYTSEGIRHELIFDPDTSALLGEQDVVVDPAPTHLDVGAGTVLGWAAYLSSGVVDSISDRP